MQEKVLQQNHSGLVSPNILFLFNGIVSLLGWNAILSSLDYFAYIYPQNVFTWFPIPIFVAYFINGILFHEITKRIPYKHLVIAGILLTNISLVLIFLTTIIFKNMTTIGFYLSLLVTFLLGLGGNLMQLSFYSLMNYLNHQVVTNCTVGTALSGLSIVGIRAIIILIAGDDRSNVIPILIYFTIAILFNFFDLFLNISFFNSPLYLNQIDKHSPYSEHQSQISQSEKSNKQLNEEISKYSPQIKLSFFKRLKITSAAIYPYQHLIFLNYIITFLVFPGVTMHITFKQLGFVWSSVLLVLVYNIGDTIGRILGSFRTFFNEKSAIYSFFCRFYFLFTIAILANKAAGEDPLLFNIPFVYINQLLFAFTNGFLTTACFIFGFQKAPVAYKKDSGVLCGLCLQFGIMGGTFLQIPYSYLVMGQLT